MKRILIISSVILIIIIILLIVLLVRCGCDEDVYEVTSTPTSTTSSIPSPTPTLPTTTEPTTYADLRDYLKQVNEILGEMEDIYAEMSELVEEAWSFGLSDFDNTIRTYKHKYRDILLDFTAINCPDEAIKLQEYTVIIMMLCVDEMEALLQFYYSEDYQYIDEIESYEEEILENIFKAADEWDRLTELSGPVHGPFSFF